MTTSPPSNSSGQASSGFLRLHPGGQKWIWQQKWPALRLNLEAGEDADEAVAPQDELDIAAHLFRVLRGDTNLIFINSRSDVESYTDRLRRLSEQ